MLVLGLFVYEFREGESFWRHVVLVYTVFEPHGLVESRGSWKGDGGGCGMRKKWEEMKNQESKVI